MAFRQQEREKRIPKIANPSTAVRGGRRLHDGRASSVASAIGTHDGQGASAASAFKQLSAADQNALVQFVQSL
jgi:CxxC motif-containing protein (DUF1111 family)